MSVMGTDSLIEMTHRKTFSSTKLPLREIIQRNTYVVLVIMKLLNLMSLKDRKAWKHQM